MSVGKGEFNVPKRIGRRFGESNNEGGDNNQNSGSDKDVLLRLKDMAQEILNLQTTIAVRQKSESPEVMSQSDQYSSGTNDGASSSTANQQQNQSTKEGRLIRRASAKMQSQSTPSMEAKIQQLSQLRYELSSELEISLQNLQQVMQKSQDIVSEMNEILKQQGGDKQT
jgi:hypothetical protein